MERERMTFHSELGSGDQVDVKRASRRCARNRSSRTRVAGWINPPKRSVGRPLQRSFEGDIGKRWATMQDLSINADGNQPASRALEPFFAGANEWSCREPSRERLSGAVDARSRVIPPAERSSGQFWRPGEPGSRLQEERRPTARGRRERPLGGPRARAGKAQSSRFSRWRRRTAAQ